MATVIISLLMLGASAYAADTGIQTKMERRSDTFNFTYICSLTGHKVEGMAWSDYRSGKHEPIGCTVASDVKIKFGEIYSDGFAQYRCDRYGKQVKLTPIACIHGDKVLLLNRGAFIGNFYYRCNSRPEGAIGLDITGCRDERLNVIVPFNGVVRRGDFQFLCQTDGKKAYETGVGCYVETQGRQKKLVKVGEKYRIGDFYYQCSQKDTRGIKTEVIGCANEHGELANIGDRLRSGIILYQCNDTDGIHFEPIGCVIKDKTTHQLVEYLFGDSFYESYKEGLSYKMVCMQDDDEIGPQIVECMASSKGEEPVSLKVGCGGSFMGKAFICRDTGEGVMAKLKSISKRKTLDEVLLEHGVPLC